MKIVSWNVNSLRARLTRVTDLDWPAPAGSAVSSRDNQGPDADFPRLELESMGYTTAFYGQKAYNGVALVAKGRSTGCKERV